MDVYRAPKSKPEEMSSTASVDLSNDAKIRNGFITVTFDISTEDATERFTEVTLYIYRRDVENLNLKMKEALEIEKRLQQEKARRDEEEISKLRGLLGQVKEVAKDSSASVEKFRRILIDGNQYG